MKTASEPVIHVLNVGEASSDELIVAGMKAIQLVRATQPDGEVFAACSLDGFDDDPREVWAIPEAVALCRRLIALGAIADLTPLVMLRPEGVPIPHPLLLGGLGAFDVWMLGHGHIRADGYYRITPELFDQFRAALEYANTVSEDHTSRYRAAK